MLNCAFREIQHGAFLQNAPITFPTVIESLQYNSQYYMYLNTCDGSSYLVLEVSENLESVQHY